MYLIGNPGEEESFLYNTSMAPSVETESIYALTCNSQFLFKNYFMCYECFACMYLCMHVSAPHACPDPLELELQLSTMQVLRIELRSSVRAEDLTAEPTLQSLI